MDNWHKFNGNKLNFLNEGKIFKIMIRDQNVLSFQIDEFFR